MLVLVTLLLLMVLLLVLRAGDGAGAGAAGAAAAAAAAATAAGAVGAAGDAAAAAAAGAIGGTVASGAAAACYYLLRHANTSDHLLTRTTNSLLLPTLTRNPPNTSQWCFKPLLYLRSTYKNLASHHYHICLNAPFYYLLPTSDFLGLLYYYYYYYY